MSTEQNENENENEKTDDDPTTVGTYDTDGSHYDEAAYADDEPAEAATTEAREPFLCDDPSSLCDDPNSVLAE